MTRRYLTPRQKHATMRAQGWKCACGCGAPVWPGGVVEYDHTLPLALGGPEKPDSALTRWCHTAKTKDDVKRISKADRQGKAYRGEKKAKRPFRKPPEGHRYSWPSRAIPSRKVREARR